jgi:hypothetical protein
VAYNFVTEEAVLFVSIYMELLPSDLPLFLAVKQNIDGGNSCNTVDDKTGHGLISTGIRNLVSLCDKRLSWVQTMWKNGWITVRLYLRCSY